jgi:hypothetical protein
MQVGKRRSQKMLGYSRNGGRGSRQGALPFGHAGVVLGHLDFAAGFGLEPATNENPVGKGDRYQVTCESSSKVVNRVTSKSSKIQLKKATDIKLLVNPVVKLVNQTTVEG